MGRKDSVIGHAAALVAYAIFGFNIIVCKDLTSGHLIPPLGIFTLRSLVAGMVFGGVIIVSYSRSAHSNEGISK